MQFDSNDKYIITLKEITDMIGVRHNDAMAKVDRLAMQPDFGVLRKTRISHIKGKEIDTFIFTKKQAIAVGARLNDALLMQVINRVEELEKQNGFKVPQTYSEALMVAAQQAYQIEQQTKQLEAQKPKVALADAITASEGSISIKDFAKVLCNDGVNVGEKRLFSWMRGSGYLDRNNKPYQRYIDAGYIKLKEGVFTHSIGGEMPYVQTRITGKGQVYFAERIIKSFGKETA